MGFRLSSLFSNAERAGGVPIELYTFRRGLESWHYTSADMTQTVDDIDYTPAVITRKAIEQSKDTGGEQLAVTISLDTPFGQALLDAGFQQIVCSIRRMQSAGDPIAPVFMGSVLQCAFEDNHANLTVATVEHCFNTAIPRVLIQRTCPYALFSTSCGLNKADYAVPTTITAITRGANQSTVTVAESLSDNARQGGMLALSNGRLMFIVKNVGSVLTLWGRVPNDVATSDDVTLYPGCDKTFDTCEGTFDNAANFGGFPNLPDRNVSTAPMR